MRKFSKYAIKDRQVLENLDVLANKSSSSQEYSKAFYLLGEKLSIQIKKRTEKFKNLVLACSTEDADWLAKGIFDNLLNYEKRLVVFWNLRTSPFGNKDLTIAPIIKTYKEQINECEVLIICKSIIYTSCVVRTNLTNLIEDLNPKIILIAAPVLFSSAEKSLSSEFSDEISSKFEFLYFAIDDVVNEKGEVEPGIGGEIYKRLGLGDTITKNAYIPQLVKTRRELNFIL